MKVALVVVGIAAALIASGSATVEQATAARMDPIPAVALVVLLEVVNIAGTWTWMSDRRGHVQWEAGIGVLFASTVTGACGLLSYGLIGIVPALGVLFTVHLTGRLTHAKQPAAKPLEGGATGPDTESPKVPDPATVTVVPAAAAELSTAGDEAVNGVPSATYRYTADPVLPASPAVRDTADTGPATEPLEVAKPVVRHVDLSLDLTPTPPKPSVAEPPAKPAPKPALVASRALEEDRAMELIAAAREEGRKLSESQLLAALRETHPDATKYRAKKYLGNRTRRLEAVG